MAEPHDREGVASFFVPDTLLVPGNALALGEEVARHVRARRLGLGAHVLLLDGEGRSARATLVRLVKGSVTADIEDVTAIGAPPPVHLLVPIADRDRMLWLAEKCTELGATSWRPVMYRRSRSVKPRGEGPTFTARLRARMASALEQSGGRWLPAMYPDATLERALGALPSGARLLFDADGAPILSPPAVGAIVGAATVAIGPEGGLEEEEIERFLSAGFQRVALGGNILRFETAAIAALAIVRSALHLAEHSHVA